MMNHAKRPLALVLVCMLLMGMLSTMAFARDSGCPHCGRGEMFPAPAQQWVRTSQQRICPDRPYGLDILMQRATDPSAAEVYVCDSCLFGLIEGSAVETRWKCHGFTRCQTVYTIQGAWLHP